MFWDPGRADIKTIQTAAAVRAISAFINRTLAHLKLNATSVLPPIATDMSDNNSVSDNTELDDNNDDDDGDSDVGDEIDEVEVDTHSDKTATITITAAETEVNNNRNSDSNGSSMGGNNIPRSSETVNESIPLAISDQQLSSNNIPIILCGDFNTFLEVESVDADSGFIPSSMYQLLRTGSLARDHPQHPDTWSSRKDMPHENPRLGALHLPRDRDLLFENAYVMEEFSPFKPLFTTKTDEFQGWIDHVWINRHVQVQGVLRPPVFAMDLQASAKAQSFPPMPNAVSVLNLNLTLHIYNTIIFLILF